MFDVLFESLGRLVSDVLFGGLDWLMSDVLFEGLGRLCRRPHAML